MLKLLNGETEQEMRNKQFLERFFALDPQEQEAVRGYVEVRHAKRMKVQEERAMRAEQMRKASKGKLVAVASVKGDGAWTSLLRVGSGDSQRKV